MNHRTKAFLVRTAAFMACALLVSCAKHDNTETAEEPAPATPPPPAATPAPLEIVAEAKPVQKRLAPDGVFFLLVKKSVETSDSIIGLAPGTQVMRQADGKYAADGHTLELQPSEITNDLDVAARIAGADARAQATIKQALQAHATPANPNGPLRTSSASPTGTTTTAQSGAAAPSTSVPATQRTAGTMLDGSNNTLGGAHTKVQGGWVWEKDAAGVWVQVRPAR